MKKFTTLDLTPEEVHQTGLKEVERIRREMDDAIRRSGFEGTSRLRRALSERLEVLRRLRPSN